MLRHFPRSLISLLGAFAATAAFAQSPPLTETSAPSQRRPFASPGAPRHTERIRDVDIKHIKAELTLDAKTREVRGTVTHTLTPLYPYLSSFELDCGPRLKVSRVTAGPHGANCKFQTKGEKLAVILDKPYGPADTIDVAITYGGAPESGLHFVPSNPSSPEKPQAIWTQGEAEDNHLWLPCYDYPNDRATTEMIITVDRPLSVVSNGSLVETKDNACGTRTFHWKMDQPHSTYLITLAASEFAVYHDRVENLPVEYYVTKNVDEATARRFMGKTPKMIRFFTEKTGQPYAFSKYAQVCLPEFSGGMENTSATSMSDEALIDEIEVLEHNQDGLVAHELAHQWFGDLLTCKDWSHLWLNEGFASYFDPLFTQHDRGEDEFRLRMDRELKKYLASDRGYRRSIVESRYSSPTQLFDGMTYAKGGCVLHMLHGLVGEEGWWKGIRAYVAKHKFQVVETDDFRKAMESGSGKDLKWFFDQWLYKAGHPELKVRWHYEDADKTVRVKVEQSQTVGDETPLFRLPSMLELTEAVGQRRTVPIVIDDASCEFVIPSAVKPQMVLVDPECWLVKELDFEKSTEENVFQLDHASCVVCRINAAKALAKQAALDHKAQEALATAWKHEKCPSARTDMVALLTGRTEPSLRHQGGDSRSDHRATGNDEAFRPALMEAAKDPVARVRVAALEGLAKLEHDVQSEAIFRAAWANPNEAYGARKTALQALYNWKVKDSEELLNSALNMPAGKHRLAASALEHLLEQPGPKARELVALYCRFGQPRTLRSAALNAFERLGKEDPALQDLIVPMIDDPDHTIRRRAWSLASSLKMNRALPALEARLHKESGSTGFAGFGAFPSRQSLEQAISALKGSEASTATAPASDQASSMSELEKQAEDLENRAKELRKRIEAIKPEK
ncbi:MAG: M1 family aminopeptidase [Isosphaeraceae bacterium]